MIRNQGGELEHLNHQRQEQQHKWMQQQPGIERLLKILRSMDASPSPLAVSLFQLQQQQQLEREQLAWQQQQSPIERLSSVLRQLDAEAPPLSMSIHSMCQDAATSAVRLKELKRTRFVQCCCW